MAKVNCRVIWPSDTWLLRIWNPQVLFVSHKKEKQMYRWNPCMETFLQEGGMCCPCHPQFLQHPSALVVIFKRCCCSLFWAQMQLWAHRAFWAQHRLLALCVQQSCNSQPTSRCREEHPARARDRMDVTTHHLPCTFLRKFSQHLLTLESPRKFSLGEWWHF